MRSKVLISAVLVLLSTFTVHGGTPRDLDVTDAIFNGFDLIVEDDHTIASGEQVRWENMSVLIEGRLTNRGSLDVINTTLYLNGSRISNQGWMNVSDLDGDPVTEYDRSTILDISGNGSYVYDVTNDTMDLGIDLRRTDIRGIHFPGGKVSAYDLYCENTTFHTYNRSLFDNITMNGNGTRTAINADLQGATIKNVNIDNYSVGLDIHQALDDLVGLRITNCSMGVHLDHQAVAMGESELRNNTVQIDSDGPIDLYGSRFLGGWMNLSLGKVSNILRNYFIGMEGIRGASKGSLVHNNFIGCSKALLDPKDMVIRRNLFKECHIAIKDDKNCTIYHNSFIGNTRNAEGLVRSLWYNRTFEEGNYYSEYNGRDDGSNGRRADDGIGDTNIPHLGRDPYPLIMDHYWEMPGIPELSTIYTAGSDSIRVDWAQGDAKGFILQRSTSEDFSTMLKAWSLSEPGATITNNPNTTVYFRARSFGPAGSRGWSLPVNVDVDQRPLPPVDLSADPLEEGNALFVEWNWEGNDIHKALIYYGQEGETPKLKEAVHPTNRLIIEGLVNGIRQQIRAQTIDSIGQYSEMSRSIYASAEDTLPPPPPRDLVGNSTSNSSIMLNWNPPYIQDIGGYLLYRRGPGDQESKLIKNLSRNTYSFEDTGLLDNTTYHYSMASVDDDGPISNVGEEITVRTDHYNQIPYFAGRDQIIYLIEDQDPGSLELQGLFRDDDGDQLELSISESYPFQANLIGEVLWVTPGPDRSGEGYVEISVSDGEATARYLIGVLVEPRPDAPRDVRIVSPLNGSVLLPGSSVKLQGTGYDPDVDQGDMLRVTWTSDRQGILSQSTQGNLFAVVELGPGRHRITLEVEDSTGNLVTRNVSVILSLWGWGGTPWEVSLLGTKPLDGGVQTALELSIENQSPFVLRFLIRGTVGDASELAERMVLIGPDTDGKVLMELPEGLQKGKDIEISLTFEGETMNGTFAGSQQLEDLIRIEELDGEDDDDIWIPVVIAVSTLIMIGIGVYFLIISRRKGPVDIIK